jgi:hypothetical protein
MKNLADFRNNLLSGEIVFFFFEDPILPLSLYLIDSISPFLNNFFTIEVEVREVSLIIGVYLDDLVLRGLAV